MSNIIVSDKLDTISPSFCLAKWNMVSLHLTNGMTHSCYHNPPHPISLKGLQENPGLLHNTDKKITERTQMRNGERPDGCSYCWRIEDSGHKSDRHYRADEWWNGVDFEKISKGDLHLDSNITPAYVEVNFNQTCNFKCIYCSPHLSSSWEEEIEEHGPYTMYLGSHNNIKSLIDKKLMPKRTAQKDNPYVQAFWKWWPEIYPNLKIFRMTGGEPLVDHNTWKVLDYANENPNPNLEISVTSNFCPPKPELFDKFINKIKALEEVRVYNFNNKERCGPGIKYFNMFVSLDSVGKQAEYIRTGLNYNTLESNVKRFLNETSGTSLTFINTFNMLSITKHLEFLQMILKLRQEYSKKNQSEVTIQIPNKPSYLPFVREKTQRIWFDVPLLNTPSWLNIKLLSDMPEFVSMLADCIAFMQDNKMDDNLVGFYDYEIDKVQRNYDILKEGKRQAELVVDKRRFCDFVDELDKRRNTNFQNTFPELAQFYTDIKNEVQSQKALKYEYNINNINLVHFELSNKCNAACPSCARNTGGVKLPWLDTKELYLDDVKKIMEGARFLPRTNVLYCGNYGDPATARDLIPIIKWFQEQTGKYHQRMQIVNTNGGLRTKAFWRELASCFPKGEGNGRVTFSVDGLSDTNHIYRKNVVWSKLWENMNAYVEAGGEARWEFLIFGHNKHQVEEARKIAEDLGMEFTPKRPFGFDASGGRLDQQKYTHAWNRQHEYEYSIVSAEDPDTGPVVLPTMVGEKQIPTQEEPKLAHKIIATDAENEFSKESCIKCKSLGQDKQGWHQIYIRSDGHLLPCCFMDGVTHSKPYNFASQQMKDTILKTYPHLNCLDRPIEDVIMDTQVKKAFFDPMNLKNAKEGKPMFCVDHCGDSNFVDLLYSKYEEKR